MEYSIEHAWNHYRELKLPTIRNAHNDLRIWNMHIAPYLAQKPLTEVRNIDVMMLRAKIEEKKLSPQTVKHVLGLLRRILRKAVQWDLYAGPVPIFDMPKVDNQRVRFLTHGESQFLLNQLKNSSELWHDISLFALHTGLRSGEIFSLRSEHISLEASQLVVLDGKSVNRTVPLNQAALYVASKYYSTNALLFTNKFGNPFRASGKTYRNAVKRCGFNTGVTNDLQKVVFHTLRHTFASWLVQKGEPLAVVSQLLGHSDIKMTMRYAHLAPDQGRSAVAKLDW